MRFFSKSDSVSPRTPNLRDDRLNFLIDKLGIGGTNAMNITWDDLANVLVFLLEAEAKRRDEAESNEPSLRGHPQKNGQRSAD